MRAEILCFMNKKDDKTSPLLNKMTIVSICSSLDGFVLADKINKFFSLAMVISDNFIVKGVGDSFMEYECFSYYISQHRMTLLLVDNKEINNTKELISNSQTTNFLFIIIGRDHNTMGQHFISSLESLQGEYQFDDSQSDFASLFPSNIQGINWVKTNIVYPNSNKKQLVRNHLLKSIVNYKEEVLLNFEEM